MPATLVALYLVRNFEAVCNRAIYLANRISQLPNQIRLMKNLFTWGSCARYNFTHGDNRTKTTILLSVQPHYHARLMRSTILGTFPSLPLNKYYQMKSVY